MSAAISCTNCGSIVPPGHNFCGQCGTSISVGNEKRKTGLFSTLMASGKARLTLIQGKGEGPGMAYYLNASSQNVGREFGEVLFDEDETVSPKHGRFFYEGSDLFVEDDESLNGVYFRLRKAHALEDGDRFRVGAQFLQFDTLPEESAPTDEAGTSLYVSPSRKKNFRVLHLLDQGVEGQARVFINDVTIGHAECSMTFPEDEHISHHHAQIAKGDQGYILTDLDSTNGTYIRVRGKQKLQHGDYLFVGQQLLRVEFSP